MRKGHCLLLPLSALCLVALCIADADDPSLKPLNETDAERLKRHLLQHYDRTLRPSQHYNVTNVDLKLTITHVDIDEETSVFSVYGWIGMSWTDLRMTWKPADYNGLSSLSLQSYLLWEPDIKLHSSTLESVDTYSYYSMIETVKIQPDGIHSCVIRINAKTACEMNLRKWPFDTQHCSVVVGRTINTADDAIAFNAKADTNDNLSSNPSWKVIDVAVEDYRLPMEQASSDYAGVKYGVIIKRREGMSQSTVVAPAIVFILMVLTNFWLPPTASEKILLISFNITIVSAFLLYFTSYLPMLATRAPLVVLFFSNSLYLNAVCLILFVVVINISTAKHTKSVHPYIKTLLSYPAIEVLIWTGNIAMNLSKDEESWCDEIQVDSLPDESSSTIDESVQAQRLIQRDWMRFAIALERIMFIIFVLIYSFMAAYYLTE